MTKRFTIVLVICLALAILVAQAWGGSLQDIPPGGTVFIGEQGLNLTGIPSGTTLAWYTGTDIVGRSVPAATITIVNNASFYVSPSEFSRRMGNWYIGDSGEVGFSVSDPSQTIYVYDQQTQKDVTNRSTPSGHFLAFRVETNMYVVPAQRPGAAGFLTIRVRAPDGTVYTRLYQDDEILLNLADLAPDAMPWYWVPLEKNSEEGWSTGFRGPERNFVYREGTYTFWTESSLNGMKDTYKDASGNDFTGRTVSAIHSVTTIPNKVKIVASNVSVVRGRPFTVTITGTPEFIYYLWVEGTSSMSGSAGDQPPAIKLSQEGVRMDPKNGPWPIGQYMPQGSKKTIQQDVAQRYNRENVNGVVYYAAVTLPSSGNRTVAFSTTKDTKGNTYSIRVERPEPYDPPASNKGGDRTFKSDKVRVMIEEGGVEMNEGGEASDDPAAAMAPGTQGYFFGEEVTLTGTNTDSDFTYLFITGPNLPAAGGDINDPRKPISLEDPDSFARAEVNESTWEYVWETAKLSIDTGAYTIYAVSSPVNKSHLTDQSSCDPDDPECEEYDPPLYSTLSVILKKPFISARASPPVVASGDELIIRGIASGQPEDGVAVWILGKNQVLYQAPSVNTDGTFELELSTAQTAAMAAGQYFVVAQHPMTNEIFDVWPASSVAGYNNKALVVGSYPVSGNTLFKLQGEGSLLGPDAADALVQALNNPGIDDIYAKLQFLVEVPMITILPVDGKQVSDNFTLAGTTNLAAGDKVLVEVISSSFGPAAKTESGEFSGTSGTVTVRKVADGLNRWSFPVNTAPFTPDEYLVQVSGITVDAQASTRFSVAPFNPATHRPVMPYVEIAEVPDTIVTGPVHVNTTMSDEDASDESDYLSIGAKESKLARVIGSPPTTFLTPVETIAPVEYTTTTAIPPRATVPTTRPTIQPGLDALITIIGLGVVASHVRRKN